MVVFFKNEENFSLQDNFVKNNATSNIFFQNVYFTYSEGTDFFSECITSKHSHNVHIYSYKWVCIYICIYTYIQIHIIIQNTEKSYQHNWLMEMQLQYSPTPFMITSMVFKTHAVEIKPINNNNNYSNYFSTVIEFSFTVAIT